MNVSGTAPQAPRLRFDSFVFDPLKKALWRDGALVVLPPRALEVLACLLEQPGEIVTKDELFERAWGQAVVMDHSLTEAVRVLRRGLGDDAREPKFVQTVPRRGYRFVGTVEAETAEARHVDAAAAPLTPSLRPGRRLVASVFALLVALIGLAVLVSFGMRWTRPAAGAEEIAFTLSEGMPIDLRAPISKAISPDGTTVAFVSAGVTPGDTPRLWLQRIDGHEAWAIPDSDHAIQPVFSPDGTRVAYFMPAPDGLRGPEWHYFLVVAAVAGGAPTKVAETWESYPAGASWIDDENLLVTPDMYGGLARVSLGDGAIEAVTEPEPDALPHQWPDVLPGGNSALFTIPPDDRGRGAGEAKIGLVELETGDWRVIIDGGAFARYSPSGHIVFARDEQIVAVEFDIEKGTSRSNRFPLRSPVLTGISDAAFSLSSTDLMYVAGPAPVSVGSLAWVGRDGVPAWLEGAPEGNYGEPVLAPDGRTFATVISGLSEGVPFEHVQIHELDGRVRSRMTDRANISGVTYTPDGELVYAIQDAEGRRLVRQSPGSGQQRETLWTADRFATRAGSVTPDGLFLAFSHRSATIPGYIALLELAARDGPVPIPFLDSSLRRRYPAFSSDGELLAFVGRNDGDDRWQVYVAPFREGGPDLRVSVDGGDRPVWHPGERRLYYAEHDVAADRTTMWTASIIDDGELRVGERTPLFELPHAVVGFSVAPGGRILMTLRRYTRAPLESKLQLILNWPALLR